ncbi:MAG: golvesin C-terminal-like domain-containing protein, partial [Armatimonadota bacterium]
LDHIDNNYGPLIRASLVDGLMFDSVVGKVSWYGDVDTDRDGKPDLASEVDERWQKRQNLFFDMLHERFPKLLVLANDADIRHAPHINGRLWEGSRALDVIPAGYSSCFESIHTINEWVNSSRQPTSSFAIMSHPVGWQWWRLGTTGKSDALSTKGETDRVRRDFTRMRTGLFTTLMTNAYFCYDIGTTWYGYPLWYAEYDAPMGKPVGKAQEVFTGKPKTIFEWKHGDVLDFFDLPSGHIVQNDGLILKPDKSDDGWHLMLRVKPDALKLAPGRQYKVIADCEIMEKPTNFFQCVVRSIKGREQHDKGARFTDREIGEKWHIETVVIPDKYDDYSVEFDQKGGGAFKLTSLKVIEFKASYVKRDFEGGTAFLNPMNKPIKIKLKQPMQRLKDDSAPRYAFDIDDIITEAGETTYWEPVLQKYRDINKIRIKYSFESDSTWEIAKDEGHQYADTYHVSGKQGSIASWMFVAPSSDRYTIFVCVKGGKEYCESAAYELIGGSKSIIASLDQRAYNGEWVKLMESDLVKGRKYKVRMTSNGKGLTIADAIRVESCSRFNDGSQIKELTLDAFDGTFLLKKDIRIGTE